MDFDNLPDSLYTVTKTIRDNPRDPADLNFDGTETEADQSWGEVDLTFGAFVDAYADTPEEIEETADLSQDEKTAMASTSLLGNANADNFDDLVAWPVVNPATKNLNEAGLDAAASRAGSELSGETQEEAMNTIDTLNERYFEEEAEGEAAGQSQHSLEAPIVQKNSAQRIVTGPVLIPEEEDKAGDTVTKEQIEEKAHQFLSEYANIDVQHTLNNVAEPIESWILREDKEYVINGEVMQVPAGSWMLSSKVHDDETWELVEKGVITGYSIMAVKEAVLKSVDGQDAEAVTKQLQTAAESGLISAKDLKETTLEKLGDDFVVNAVSLVDEPEVPKAQFVTVKNHGKSQISYKAIEGTLDEQLQERKDIVREAIRDEIGMDEDAFLFIQGLFQDSVVFEVSEGSEEASYEVGYNYDNTANSAELIGQPKPVEINEVVEPITRSVVGHLEAKVKQNSEQAEKKLNELKDDSPMAAKKFVVNYSKKAGLSTPVGSLEILDVIETSQKEGRTLSTDNFEKLAQAVDMLRDIVEQGISERDSDSLEAVLNNDNPRGKEAVDMDPEELAGIVSSAVEEGVEKGVEKALEATEASGKSESDSEETESEESDETPESTEKSEESEEGETEGNDEEPEVSTKELADRVESLAEKVERVVMKGSSSKRLVGQDPRKTSQKSDDDSPKQESTEKRDIYGRKVHNQ